MIEPVRASRRLADVAGAGRRGSESDRARRGALAPFGERRHDGGPRPRLRDRVDGALARSAADRAPRWVLHDRDAELLARAIAAAPGGPQRRAGARETRLRDITRLYPDGPVVGLPDHRVRAARLMTADEFSRLVSACAAAACAVLITLSVTAGSTSPRGPAGPDRGDAFDAHQRRAPRGTAARPGRRAAAVASTRRGLDVVTPPSPWRLGPSQRVLTAEWFTGWVGAARRAATGPRPGRRGLRRAPPGGAGRRRGRGDGAPRGPAGPADVAGQDPAAVRDPASDWRSAQSRAWSATASQPGAPQVQWSRPANS